MMAEVFRCSVLTNSELAGWYLPFYGLVMQYTNAFPKSKNSAMDTFKQNSKVMFVTYTFLVLLLLLFYFF